MTGMGSDTLGESRLNADTIGPIVFGPLNAAAHVFTTKTVCAGVG